MNIELIKGYTPGSIGRIVELHGTYYYRNAGFGLFFEAKVAGALAEFLSRYDASRDGLWLAVVDGRVEGAIAIDGLRAAEEGARLRWFIVSDGLRGRGVGNTLLSAAMELCRERGYAQVHLWTFTGLDAARHLYEKHGFRLEEERTGTQWGEEVREQRFVWSLAPTEPRQRESQEDVVMEPSTREPKSSQPDESRSTRTRKGVGSAVTRRDRAKKGSPST